MKIRILLTSVVFLLVSVGCRQTPQQLADHAHQDYTIALKAADQLVKAHQIKPAQERLILTYLPILDASLDALDQSLILGGPSFQTALQTFYAALATLNATAATGK